MGEYLRSSNYYLLHLFPRPLTNSPICPGAIGIGDGFVARGMMIFAVEEVDGVKVVGNETNTHVLANTRRHSGHQQLRKSLKVLKVSALKASAHVSFGKRCDTSDPKVFVFPSLGTNNSMYPFSMSRVSSGRDRIYS